MFRWLILKFIFIMLPCVQLEWSPDHVARGQPHPKELVGRSIERNIDGYWEV